MTYLEILKINVCRHKYYNVKRGIILTISRTNSGLYVAKDEKFTSDFLLSKGLSYRN